jgi:hypothetical protein
MGGATIIPRSPRTTQNEKNFELGQKNFEFRSKKRILTHFFISFYRGGKFLERKRLPIPGRSGVNINIIEKYI